MKRKLIICQCGKKDKFFEWTIFIYTILFFSLILMKIIGFIKVSEFSKKKDFILMNPFLTYFGESLFFFFDLICEISVDQKVMIIKQVKKIIYFLDLLVCYY